MISWGTTGTTAETLQIGPANHDHLHRLLVSRTPDALAVHTGVFEPEIVQEDDELQKEFLSWAVETIQNGIAGRRSIRVSTQL